MSTNIPKEKIGSLVHVMEWKTGPIARGDPFWYQEEFTTSEGINSNKYSVNAARIDDDRFICIVVRRHFPYKYQLTIAKDELVILKKVFLYDENKDIEYVYLPEEHVGQVLTIILEIIQN